MASALQSIEVALQYSTEIYGKDCVNCAIYNVALAEYYLTANEPVRAQDYLTASLKGLESKKIS